MKYKNILNSFKAGLMKVSDTVRSLAGKKQIKTESKLIVSLFALLVIIATPTFFAKTPKIEKLAQADSTSPTPITSPESLKAPDPSPEPIKTEKPKPALTVKPKNTSANPTTKSDSKPASPAGPASESVNTESTPPTARSEAPQPNGILGYINQVRSENGLSQLSYNSQLNSASKTKSQDMLEKNYFAHTNPDGKTDFDFIREAGYTFSFAGSNIAKGTFTEKSVFDAWMNSAGHRANILDPRAREFGYGVAGNYFTMMVGAR